MRRSLAILIWIVLGALASGASIGWFLHRSNQDRARLSQELQTANASTQSLREQIEHLTQESNQKIEAAANEVKRLQEVLRTQNETQANLQIAVTLTPPNSTQLRGWSESASVPMNVSIRIPPGMEANASDNGIFINARRYTQRTPIVEPWLALTEYQADREQEIRTRLTNTREITYALNGHILKGVRGTFMDGTQTLYLLTFQGTSTTHILWAKTVPGVTERTILNTIATISFR